VNRPHRVLVADDHAPTRETICAVLNRQEDFEVCGSVPDAPRAVAMSVRRHPDLCLLDIRMPGNGISAAWEITARLPSTKVVMLTVSRDDDDLFAALRAGASGYLLKDLDPGRLPEALRATLRGEAAINAGLVTRLIQEFRDRSPKRRVLAAGLPAGQLTSREWEVLELLREGLGTMDIAARLVVTPATVRSHVASILKKLRVPDREAALEALGELR
jgi:DNA-binding NarL/FixJ family response regulator